MKVKGAIDLLLKCNPENELVIDRQERGGIGTRSHDKIAERSFQDGFDWDNGYTFIKLETSK